MPSWAFLGFFCKISTPATVDFDQQVLLLLIGYSLGDYLGRAPLLPPDYSFTRVNFLGPKVFWRKPLCSKFIQFTERAGAAVVVIAW